MILIFICNYCQYIFDIPAKDREYYDYWGADIVRIIDVCPHCSSSDISVYEEADDNSDDEYESKGDN